LILDYNLKNQVTIPQLQLIMKINFNKAFYKLLFFLSCFYGCVAHAQTIDPPDPDEDLPIDGNIMILVFAAVLFGIYTIYKYNVKQKRPI